MTAEVFCVQGKYNIFSGRGHVRSSQSAGGLLQVELSRAAVEGMGPSRSAPWHHWHRQVPLHNSSSSHPALLAADKTTHAWPLQKKSSDAFLTGSATEAFIHAHTKHAGDLVSLKFC